MIIGSQAVVRPLHKEICNMQPDRTVAESEFLGNHMLIGLGVEYNAKPNPDNKDSSHTSLKQGARTTMDHRDHLTGASCLVLHCSPG